MMTAKEELIQAIERSPDELVYTLLEILKVLQRQSGQPTQAEPASHEQGVSRLHRKQGVLVIETGALEGVDVNAFIGEMREERIQKQMGQVNS
jgi:hypothetical protein